MEPSLTNLFVTIFFDTQNKKLSHFVIWFEHVKLHEIFVLPRVIMNLARKTHNLKDVTEYRIM